MASFRYYRLSNFVTTNTNAQRRFFEIKFINEEGVLSNDPSKAFGNGNITTTTVGNSFDGNTTTETVFLGGGFNPSQTIGYQFPTPVTVTSIYILTTPSSRYTQLSVEASNDGTNWVYYGTVIPLMGNNETGGKNYKVLLSDGVVRSVVAKVTNINNQKNIPLKNYYEAKAQITFADPYNLSKTALKDFIVNNTGKGFGYISGKIYEKVNNVLIPVSRKVYLQEQRTGVSFGYVWSNNNGEYTFKNLNVESEFIVVSVDHNKQFGLEGIAFKKPREVVINNDGTLSYPISE